MGRFRRPEGPTHANPFPNLLQSVCLLPSYTENVLHLAGLVFQVMCLAYSIHLMYYTTSLLDGELLGFVSHFFLLNASPMFSMCDGWVEKVWQQYLCSSTQPVFSVHLLFFCLQDMVFLSWAHFSPLSSQRLPSPVNVLAPTRNLRLVTCVTLHFRFSHT